jgi:carboxypeptidase PM20D1
MRLTFRFSDWRINFRSGCIRDGHAYGRGTLDVKYTLAAMMEAASFLKRRNIRPRRTVYFAFGHDEEVGGSAFCSRLPVSQ